MQNSLLRARLASFSLLAVGSLLVACGGKVFVDSSSNGGAGGMTSPTGGFGGTTNSSGFGGTHHGGSGAGTFSGTQSTSTSVMTGTSMATNVSTGATPPTCDCNTFCSIVNGCTNTNNCMNFCSQIPPSIVQCVCAQGSDCNAIKNNCFQQGTSSVSTGVGSSGIGSGGMGGGLPNGCQQCAMGTAFGACSSEYKTCEFDSDCRHLLQCHQQCGWNASCQSCDMQYPGGESKFANLLQCAVCDNCTSACANSTVENQYCNVAMPAGH